MPQTIASNELNRINRMFDHGDTPQQTAIAWYKRRFEAIHTGPNVYESEGALYLLDNAIIAETCDPSWEIDDYWTY